MIKERVTNWYPCRQAACAVDAQGPKRVKGSRHKVLSIGVPPRNMALTRPCHPCPPACEMELMTPLMVDTSFLARTAGVRWNSLFQTRVGVARLSRCTHRRAKRASERERERARERERERDRETERERERARERQRERARWRKREREIDLGPRLQVIFDILGCKLCSELRSRFVYFVGGHRGIPVSGTLM